MTDLKELRKELLAAVQEADRIAITTHQEIDGDGFCAALALQYFLTSLGKDSTIILDPGTDLSRYEFLIDNNYLCEFNHEMETVDLLIILDCNSMDRLAERRALLHKTKNTILLDHHVLENHPIKADLSCIDTSYASVGALLYEILQADIRALPISLRTKVGNCIYITVLNDTNNFINANTDAATFRIAASLADMGISPHQLYQMFFMNHSHREMRYVGQTLATIQMHLDNRVLLMHSSLAMSIENGIDPKSLMSVTRWIQGVAGVAAIVYLREDEPNLYKVSLRSPVLDVNSIAVKYGGGGHRSASGCTMNGSLESISAVLLADLQALL